MCQMTGLVICFCSSITILYSFVMVYIQWEETSVQSFLLLSLSQSKGNAFHRKEELTVQRSKCCAVKYLEYSFILYTWCCNLSHLLGLSHLQVLSLSSSWRSLQYSSVCLQVHRQVAGSCTNKRFLLSEQ